MCRPEVNLGSRSSGAVCLTLCTGSQGDPRPAEGPGLAGASVLGITYLCIPVPTVQVCRTTVEFWTWVLRCELCPSHLCGKCFRGAVSTAAPLTCGLAISGLSDGVSVLTVLVSKDPGCRRCVSDIALPFTQRAVCTGPLPLLPGGHQQDSCRWTHLFQVYAFTHVFYMSPVSAALLTITNENLLGFLKPLTLTHGLLV